MTRDSAKSRGQSFFLTVFLVSLILIAIALAIANIITFFNSQSTTELSSDSIGVDITKRLESEEITTEEANALFKRNIANRSGDAKIWAALSYVNFLFNETSDPSICIKELLKIKITDNYTLNAKVGYYSALSNYYSQLGDTENTELYDSIIQELLPPDEPPKLEENENE